MTTARSPVPRGTRAVGGRQHLLGSPAGRTSPVRTFTPLLGAEIVVEPRATVTLGVDAAFEHGLRDSGDVRLIDTVLLANLATSHPARASTLTMVNETDTPARTVLLGGPPFGGDRHVVELRRPQPGRG
ncbi:hypothetical protein SVIOM342S_01691 [Streptomyces violaceorubidus]